MFEELKKILQDECYVTDVSLTDNIKKDLGLNSLDFANLICIIEEKFGIEIEEEKYRSIETVEDFVKYINSLNCR